MAEFALVLAIVASLLSLFVVVADIRRFFRRDERLWEAVPLSTFLFLRRVDADIARARGLLARDRSEAAAVLKSLQDRLQARRGKGRKIGSQARLALEQREVATQVVHSELLFNAGNPMQAGAIAENMVEAVRAARPQSSHAKTEWEALEMEALYSLSCAQDLSGDFDAALRTARRAATIAERQPSALSRRVISTYANILLMEDPRSSEACAP